MISTQQNQSKLETMSISSMETNLIGHRLILAELDKNRRPEFRKLRNW